MGVIAWSTAEVGQSVFSGLHARGELRYVVAGPKEPVRNAEVDQHQVRLAGAAAVNSRAVKDENLAAPRTDESAWLRFVAVLVRRHSETRS